MKTYKYEQITPVIPGNDAADWQKVRKKQWKYVKGSLESLFVNKDEIKYLKQDYLSDSLTGDNHPCYWEPVPLIGMWLSPDQSEVMWQQVWDSLLGESKGWSYDFKRTREEFFTVAHSGEQGVTVNDQVFGAFGGLEQRLLKEFVRSDVYTDDTFELWENEYRKIPWESPRRTFGAILAYMTELFTPYEKENGEKNILVSPYSPYQWLHNLLVSTFDHGVENDFDQQSVNAYCRRLKGIFDQDIRDLCHPDHLVAGDRLVEIFEDEMAPKFLRDTWIKARDRKI